jgi:hypothetical protein
VNANAKNLPPPPPPPPLHVDDSSSAQSEPMVQDEDDPLLEERSSVDKAASGVPLWKFWKLRAWRDVSTRKTSNGMLILGTLRGGSKR